MISTNNRKTYEAYKKVFDSNVLIDIVGIKYLVESIDVEEYDFSFLGMVPNQFQARIYLKEVVTL